MMPLFRFPIQFRVIGCENFLLQNGEKNETLKSFCNDIYLQYTKYVETNIKARRKYI